MRTLRLATVALLVISVAAFAQVAKKPLTHDVYDSWKALAGIDLSRNGKWVTYSISPQVGDGEMYVEPTAGGGKITIARGSAGRFTKDSKYFLATIVPAKAEVDKARKEKKPLKDQPKNSLVIYNLVSGEKTLIERVKTWRMPVRDSGWLAYQLEEPPTPPKPEAAPAAPKPPEDGQQSPPAQGEQKKDEPKKKKDHAVGTEWILREIASGKEVKLADVADLQFDDEGGRILYSVSSKAGDKDGLFWMALSTGAVTPIATGMAQYRQVSIHKFTGAVLFVTDRDRYDKEPTQWAIHIWRPGDKSSAEVISDVTPGIPAGHCLPGRGGLSLSQDGRRILLATAPKPEPEAKPADETEEKAVVDVWSYTDKILMPQQLLQAASERNRTFAAIFDLNTKKLVSLEDGEMSAQVGERGNARYALGRIDDPYQLAGSWGADAVDIYSIDTSNGQRRLLVKEFKDNAILAPNGRTVVLWDADARQYFALDLVSGVKTLISGGIPTPLYDRLNDRPSRAIPAGGMQFTDDNRVVVSDSRDLWVLSLDGRTAPKCITDGVGTLRNWRFAIQPFPREDDVVGLETKGPLLLSVTDMDTYATGFFLDSFDGKDAPKMLIMKDCGMTVATKAEDTDDLAIRCQTFVEYPDLWLTNTRFETPRKITETNPQQKEYIWGKAEQIHWLSADGDELMGVVIKPEDFDPTKKYPMIVYFYERDSDQLHTHRVPAPSASTINPTMFASNGYVVFMPDIPYTIGFPGESAEKAIISGTLEVLRRGYVDPKRVGIQGQSWGGYQVMHLITRTKLFAAAGAGAAVSNMFSAYGGIRLGSGIVREVQYEVGQSRIGGSIWEMPLRYLENSPLFWADKVSTPVLMMNNDQDDAVPFSQGVEMFTALRRLGKVAWMLNYNNDKHNIMQRANRKDYTIRLHQFFDHYLKGAPMPKWMAEGIPATKKGKDFGFELVNSGGSRN